MFHELLVDMADVISFQECKGMKCDINCPMYMKDEENLCDQLLFMAVKLKRRIKEVEGINKNNKKK